MSRFGHTFSTMMLLSILCMSCRNERSAGDTTKLAGDTGPSGAPALSQDSRRPPERDVLFFVPPLPSQAHRRDEPVTVWSYLDDTDSIFAVLRRSPPGGTVAGAVRILVQRVPWEGEESTLPDSVAADTVGQWVEWETLPRVTLASLPEAFGGRLLSLLRPSALQGAPRLHLGEGRFATKIRIVVDIDGGPADSADIQLMTPS